MINDLLAAQGITYSWLVAGIILGSFILLSLFVGLLFNRLVRPFIRWISADFSNLLVPPFRRIVVVGIILLGINEASQVLTLPKELARLDALIGKSLSIVWILVIFWQLLVIVNSLFTWYFKRQISEGGDISHLGYKVTLFRKLINFILGAIGLLFILKTAKVDISPLLAGGAIGGLAIGLALQDTLSNLFAGFYIAADRPVRVGDYIKLENGEEGYVEEIGWRNTKVRPHSNNLIIIPNSTLSQSTITNYYMPRQESAAYIRCGVAYDSDLQHVEDIAVEVGKEIEQKIPGAAPEWTPLVRWQEFGDSSINFLVILRVRQHDIKWLLQSEYIKALHKRFNEEGIEIPFPIRTTILKSHPEDQTRIIIANEQNSGNGQPES